MKSCVQTAFAIVILAALAATPRAGAQQPLIAPPKPAPLPGNWNIPSKTLGGLEFWGDEMILSGWRIQRNAFTGHCRLLDDENCRQAWGSLEECRAALEIVRTTKGLAPIRGRVVIVLHGLAGVRPMTNGMCRYLKEQGNLNAVAVSYPSTRVDVDADAEALERIVANLPEAQQIDFVCHSLGNIVLRRYLAMNTDAATGKRPDPRIKRIVMLAPPNHGAVEAKKLVSLDFSKQIVGPAARQLTMDWAKLEPKLVVPTCEFGIIAGGRGEEHGYNRLMSGDNDGVLTIETTKLGGASDFRTVPAMHILFMSYAKVQEYTLRFLQDGCFDTEDKRTPL